jgi:serine/alanine adding enzyme
MTNPTTEIQIKHLTIECIQWDQYIYESPSASLYHVTGWKRVIEKTFGHPTFYLYAFQDDQIVGILPLVYLKSFLFGKFFVSLPYFNYGGLVAEREDVRQRLRDEAITIAQSECIPNSFL